MKISTKTETTINQQIITNLTKSFNVIIKSKMNVGISIVHYPEQIKFKYSKSIVNGKKIVIATCPCIENMKEKEMKLLLYIHEALDPNFNYC